MPGMDSTAVREPLSPLAAEEAARDEYQRALIGLAFAAEQVLFDADAGELGVRNSIEMLRPRVEAWAQARRDYFSGPVRTLRRSLEVHPAHEVVEP